MARQSRDAAFAELVPSFRGVLLGAAQLMWGRADRAEDVVQAVLAGIYRSWPGGSDPRDVVLRQVLQADPGRLALPWRDDGKFELLDASSDQPVLPPGIISDLAALDDEPRRVIILARWVGLPGPHIATLLGSSEAEVEAWESQAKARLAAQDPVRQDDRQLSDELRAALPPPDAEINAAADLAHGRSLVRRRDRRRLLVAAAVVLVAILGVTQLGPRQQPEHHEARGPVPSPARSTIRCNTADAGCRASVVQDWRSRMAVVTSSYLDPAGSYFDGYTYSDDDDRYETPSFFSGAGGALGFDMFVLGSGTTNVYVQIATSDEYALRCGVTTHHACLGTTYMDGNTFFLTDASRATEGLEVQYAPTTDAVITVVARTVTGGPTLDITRGQLVLLAQDDRLRLPAI